MDAFSSEPKTDAWIQSPALLRAHISRMLFTADFMEALRAVHPDGLRRLSAVLLLIGMDRSSPACAPEPYLILNKRSHRVRQPGDICCPGGGIEPRIDPILARLLRVPGSPLKRWPHFFKWPPDRPDELHQLRLLLAAALREGLEEMRLNPLTVRFLGGLPPEPLVMFRRVIQPLVVWAGRQRRFYPNWEVAQVVKIAVRDLLNPAHYICYRLTMPSRHPGAASGGRLDFPAFRFEAPYGAEFLWGATFRIAMGFLNKVMDFTPPEIETLDVVEREMPTRYMTGGD